MPLLLKLAGIVCVVVVAAAVVVGRVAAIAAPGVAVDPSIAAAAVEADATVARWTTGDVDAAEVDAAVIVHEFAVADVVRGGVSEEGVAGVIGWMSENAATVAVRRP